MDTTGQGYVTLRLPYEDWVAIQVALEKWTGRPRDDIQILEDVTVLGSGL